MSLRAILWAIYEAPVDNPTSRLVLVGLADHAADDGTGAWPSHAVLAAAAHCSPRTIRRHLQTLEDSGVIHRGDQRIVNHIRADRRPTVWNLNLDHADRTAATHATHATPTQHPEPEPEPAPAQPVDAGSVETFSVQNGGTNCPPVKTGENTLNGEIPPKTNGGSHMSGRTNGGTHVSYKPIEPIDTYNAPARDTTPTPTPTAKVAPPPTDATPLPDTWTPNPDHLNLACQQDLSITTEATRFRLHAHEHHRKACDWDAAFTRWLLDTTPRPPTRHPDGRDTNQTRHGQHHSTAAAVREHNRIRDRERRRVETAALAAARADPTQQAQADQAKQRIRDLVRRAS
ncbi:helix-turn-helix domain-containing protein [Actinobaculum sp. 352]|uniref:helix-turn-helix domain-containing protein n=1 Tax=Actinobaculum sp. 352 TaxID=2490946 RepID=UPI000F7D7993|nr:helix-turn-helix domain-containing protein [Actinobaculum sp. 352]RTE48809.1 helix-turn-helix domain-containing protein [Actinobaculum sp. 352]